MLCANFISWNQLTYILTHLNKSLEAMYLQIHTQLIIEQRHKIEACS